MKKKLKLSAYVDSVGGTLAAAYHIGVTQTTVYRWLSGESKPKGRNVLEKLAGLGVEV